MVLPVSVFTKICIATWVEGENGGGERCGGRVLRGEWCLALRVALMNRDLTQRLRSPEPAGMFFSVCSVRNDLISL